MNKVMFNFQYHKGIIKSESNIFGMNLLNTFCPLESAAALNEFKYFFFALIMFTMPRSEVLHDNLYLNCLIIFRGVRSYKSSSNF